MKPLLDAAAGAPSKKDLHDLGEWRNAAAHQNAVLPAGVPLTVPTIKGWQNSCNVIATSLDGIMCNQLKKRLRRKPWVI